MFVLDIDTKEALGALKYEVSLSVTEIDFGLPKKEGIYWKFLTHPAKNNKRGVVVGG